jgi:YggT family protein
MGDIYGAAFQAVNNGESCRRNGCGRPDSALSYELCTVPGAGKPRLRPSLSGVSAMPTNPFLWLIHEIIWLYIYIVIAMAILSWLIAFNVVNTRNDIVRGIANFLYRVTEPVLAPIRSILPNMGGIDLSPIILLIGLMFLDRLVDWIYVRLFV